MAARSITHDKDAEFAAKYDAVVASFTHLKRAYDELLFKYEKLSRQVVGPKRERTPESDDDRQPLLAEVLRLLNEMGALPSEDDDGDGPDGGDGDDGDDGDALRAARKNARSDGKKPKRKPRRRDLSLEDLPVERFELDPPERSLPGGERLVKIGEEVSRHIERRRASLVIVEMVRNKFAAPDDLVASATAGEAGSSAVNDVADEGVADGKVAAAAPSGNAVVDDAAVDDAAAIDAAGNDVICDDESAGSDTAADGDDVPRYGAPLGAAPRPPRQRIFIAPLPPRVINKGMAGAGLLAHVLVSKYCDHLPWHRLSSMIARGGVRFAPSVLCDWTEGCVAHLRHITDAMWSDAESNAAYTIVDATGVLVLAKRQCRRAHFYVAVVPDDHVLFRYTRKNDGEHVKQLFAGFSGYVHADAASVYHELYRTADVVEVGCWSHCRRKFFEAYSRDKERALMGIGLIGQLYEADRASRDNKTGRVDAAKRAELAGPVLDRLRAWVHEQLVLVEPGTPIHLALGYVDRQWEPLTRFLADGRLRLDTNHAERELRREAKGRDNWTFCATDEGAKWNAVVVTLVASCQMHGIEPWAYLRDVLTLLPAWDKARALELSPKCWRATRETDEVQALLRRLRLIDYGDDAAPPRRR